MKKEYCGFINIHWTAVGPWNCMFIKVHAISNTCNIIVHVLINSVSMNFIPETVNNSLYTIDAKEF